MTWVSLWPLPWQPQWSWDCNMIMINLGSLILKQDSSFSKGHKSNVMFICHYCLPKFSLYSINLRRTSLSLTAFFDHASLFILSTFLNKAWLIIYFKLIKGYHWVSMMCQAIIRLFKQRNRTITWLAQGHTLRSDNVCVTGYSSEFHAAPGAKLSAESKRWSYPSVCWKYQPPTPKAGRKYPSHNHVFTPLRHNKGIWRRYSFPFKECNVPEDWRKREISSLPQPRVPLWINNKG